MNQTREPELKYVMTYLEKIEGPSKSTKGSAFGERICWSITKAKLTGMVNATLISAGADWMRLGKDDIRRPDNRVYLLTDDNEAIFFSYDNAIIRSNEKFLNALQSGKETDFHDQYMYMTPIFEVPEGKYSWLEQNIFIGLGRLSGAKEIEYKIYQAL